MNVPERTLSVGGTFPPQSWRKESWVERYESKWEETILPVTALISYERSTQRKLNSRTRLIASLLRATWWCWFSRVRILQYLSFCLIKRLVNGKHYKETKCDGSPQGCEEECPLEDICIVSTNTVGLYKICSTFVNCISEVDASVYVSTIHWTATTYVELSSNPFDSVNAQEKVRDWPAAINSNNDKVERTITPTQSGL